MNKAHIDLLKSKWHDVVTEYCDLFCEKHGYEYEPDGWAGDDIGGVLTVGDYFISFDVIRYDIDHDVPEETFIQYYDYSLELSYLTDGKVNVNYPSYCKGCRPCTPQQMELLTEAKKRVQDAEEHLNELVEGHRGF